jgi:hypothetical protein
LFGAWVWNVGDTGEDRFGTTVPRMRDLNSEIPSIEDIRSLAIDVLPFSSSAEGTSIVTRDTHARASAQY